MAINTLSLSGHLVKDFEFVKGVAKSSIAINTWDKKTFYVDLVAFKKTAEYITKGKYLKGELVVVSGELNINVYQDKKYVQCVIKEIDRIGNRKDQDDIDIVESGAGLGEPKEAELNDEEISIDDDTLPF